MNAALTPCYPSFPVWDEYTHIYAILDAARDEEIYKMLMGCTEEFTCLFNGNIPVVLARAAPYLIKLKTGTALFEKIYQQGFFHHWGVFFSSSDSGKNLKRHFQNLLRVKTENGRRLFFRYYDPRVLRVYLPTCTQSELREFFGNANKIWVAGEPSSTIIEYGKNSDKFYITTVDLAANT